MSIEQLSPAWLEAVKRFSELRWRRPRSDNYYRWRYLEPPGHMTLIAMEGERCIATVSAFVRHYQSANGPVECLEPFDWSTLPAVTGFGVGARLMKALMDTGKPIVSLGGSDDSLTALPRLGFKPIAFATEFFLPLTGNYILRNRPVVRTVAAPLLDVAMSLWFKPPRPGEALAFHVQPGIVFDDDLGKIAGPEGFRPIPDPRFLSWLGDGMGIGIGIGSFVTTAVRKGNETVAWFLCRVYRSGGLRHGEILDVRLKTLDADVAVVVLKGAGRILANLGVDKARAYTTSDFFASAYSAAGYRAGEKSIPALMWRGKHALAIDDRVILSCCQDDAFRPLEEQPAEFTSTAGTRLACESAP